MNPTPEITEPTTSEHREAAEHLLSGASYTAGTNDLTPISSQGTRLSLTVHASLIARAQVHALLELASAIRSLDC